MEGLTEMEIQRCLLSFYGECYVPLALDVYCIERK